MNWARNLSAYQSMVSWREKRKAFQEKYEANWRTRSPRLQTAWNDVGYNLGEIAANRAMKRIQDEAKVKQEKLQAQLANENTRPYQPTYSKITESGSAELDGRCEDRSEQQQADHVGRNGDRSAPPV